MELNWNHILNIILYLIIIILEAVGLYFISQVLYSHCVLAGEFYMSVWMYVFLVPVVLVQTIIFILLRICFSTAGLDMYATHFHLISGLAVALTGCTLLIAMLDHCGNNNASYFNTAAMTALVAGILHILLTIANSTLAPKSTISIDSI